MFYWLFTEGRAALGGCLMPLVCLVPLTPVIAAALMGVSIRRTDEEKQNTRRDLVLHLLTHLVVSWGIVALYLTLMGSFAIHRAVVPQVDNGFIKTVTGGPPTINRMRLFMAGLMGCMALGVANVVLHEGLRQGGWLRERVDRLRRPAVRRGSLGSSHFCTMREYRRYRRSDREGITIFGAFWGEDALAYLVEKRGLESRTIREARLGYVPGDYRQWRTIAGLKVPCGIVLPWITGETLWAVKVRRAADQPKYEQIPGGSSGGLYRGDALLGAQAVLFTEGEFDALLAHQEADGMVAAVTLGSAASTLNDRWALDLLTVPLILVAYDTDGAGMKGAARLRMLSNRVHTIEVPEGKDITEYHQRGGDVFTWLSQELRRVRMNALVEMKGVRYATTQTL